MASFEEFKTFIKDKPFLKEKVRKKEITWQELYERYDLYGKDDDIFQNNIDENKNEENNEQKEEKDKKDDSMSSFFNMLSGIDVDKISDGLNGMKKILSILSEITVGDELNSFTSRRANKPYKRDDD